MGFMRVKGMGRGEGITHPRQIEKREKEAQALKLRKKGLTYPQIGKEMGMTGSKCCQLVLRALKNLHLETAPHVRRMELSRLDDMLFAIWEKVMGGDLPSIDRALKIMERRAAFLGLDATTKGGDAHGGAVEVRIQWGGEKPPSEEIPTDSYTVLKEAQKLLEAKRRETDDERSGSVSEKPER